MKHPGDETCVADDGAGFWLDGHYCEGHGASCSEEANCEQLSIDLRALSGEDVHYVHESDNGVHKWWPDKCKADGTLNSAAYSQSQRGDEMISEPPTSDDMASMMLGAGGGALGILLVSLVIVAVKKWKKGKSEGTEAEIEMKEAVGAENV